MPAVQPKLKSTKPLMEKRRRARINDSLMQLKTLVLDALNKNNPRHSKLEKADILEMTVRYLRTIQRRQISASVNSDPAKLVKFRSGYAECINEVTRYLGTNAKTDEVPELRNQLVGHLANLGTASQQTSQVTTSQRQQLQQFQYVPTVSHQQQQQQVESASYPNVPRSAVTVNAMLPSVDSAATVPVHCDTVSPVPEGATAEFALTAPMYYTHDVTRLQASPSYTHAPQSSKNNSQVVQQHVHAEVASSHPSGEITLVLPQQALQNGQLPTHFIPVYAQGPVVVSPTANRNIQTVSPNTNVVSLPSPQTASTFQPTDGSHQSVSPSSVPTARTMSPIVDVTRYSPASFTSPAITNSAQQQTDLPPVSGKHFTYHSNCEIATYPVNQCLSKKEPMWQPWL